jgi:hypothetical protein
MTVQAYLFIVLVLAVLLDLGLQFWARRNLERRGITANNKRAVYLFNAYSPLLTWLINFNCFILNWQNFFARKRLDKTAIIDSLLNDKDTPEELSLDVGIGALPKLLGESTVSHEQVDHASTSLHMSNKSRLFEWGLIAVLVLIFAMKILDLNADTRLPGNEAEVFQVLDWTLINTLINNKQFPLWNPYLYTGLPYVADPMLHVFNPVVTIPVLLLGVRDGFKLAIFLSIIIAAFGMWRLGKDLGMGRATRIWMALMYAFAGQPVARFMQGQYLFVLAYAWIPWIISSLFLLVKTQRRRYVASAVLFMALLFFSGNVYYQFFMLFVIILFGLVMFIRFQRNKPFINIRLRSIRLYLLTGVLALGVIAIQLLPQVEFWPRVNKDLNIEGSHTLKQIFLDYTSKDSYRADAFDELPAREEFYAYIGLTPFLALGLLPFAVRSRDHKSLLFFALLLVLVVLWIDLNRMPWQDYFGQARMLLQFRHLLRMLIFGSFALIVLSGFGIDSLWVLLDRITSSTSDSRRAWLCRNLAKGGLFLLAVFMLVGVCDLMITNRKYIGTQDIYQPAYDVFSWLRRYDPEIYYVRNNPNNSWHDAMISNKHRFIDVWYHFANIRSLDGMVNKRPVIAQPHYIIQSAADAPPQATEYTLVSQVEDSNIYRLPQSLPMAFAVGNVELLKGSEAGNLQANDVTTLTPFFSGTNELEIITEGREDQSLVVLITHYPGWQVTVDGKERALKNIGGYLATDLLEGIHKYVFSYKPRPFFLGLASSLFFSAITIYLFMSDIDMSREKIKQRLQAIPQGLNNFMVSFLRQYQKKELFTEAIYREGQLQLADPLNLTENSRVRVAIESEPQLAGSKRVAARRWLWATVDLINAFLRGANLETALFVGVLSVYLLTRLIGLTDFPIYFFTDEAVHPLLAADLMRDGFENYAGDFLPTFFENGGKYRLGFTVYLHVLPTILFGKSVLVTRATSMLITVLGAYTLGLILRDFFKLRFWWSGVLFLSITPTWFLHTRTAFEYAIAVTLYIFFLYFYLKYRFHSPRFLYATLISGALAFYSYSPMQLVVLTSGVLLLISDFRYHIGLIRTAETRPVLLKGFGLLVLLVLPYARFVWAHPDANYESIRALDSYWIKSLPLLEKLKLYFSEYLAGLNPRYWFLENQHDLNRHLMKGYGHVLLVSLPFVIIGLVLVIRKFRQSEYRLLLIALLAAPAGAALIHLGITRALVMVVPLTLLTTIGVNLLLEYIESPTLSSARISIALFAVLSLFNITMMRDALINGPIWYTDYSLGGMQYGASQLFDEVLDYRQEHPGEEIRVSPSWANGTDVLARFFSPEPMPFLLGTVDPYLNDIQPLDENMLFVMTPEEMDKVQTSGKFKKIQVDRQIPYPDGRPGFFFVRLQYAENIEEVLKTEQEQRRQLQEAVVQIDDQEVLVRHSTLDMGSPQSLFDGDPYSVARTFEANPMVVELEFDQMRDITGLLLVIGSTEAEVTTKLFKPDEAEPVIFIHKIKGDEQHPEAEITFDETVEAQLVRLEILDLHQGEPGHVHVWEIEFR